MGYKINPLKWNKIFAVPSEVVDSYIKLAGSAQLKVLLWTLCHGGEETDIERLSADTGIARTDALDAMQFWLETGIMLSDGESGKSNRECAQGEGGEQSEASASSKEKAPCIPPADGENSAPRPSVTVIEPFNASIIGKPTNEDVAARGEESAEVRFLWNEAQLKLGKTLSFNDQRTLLWMHDYLGLPTEVILMIIEYSASQKKYGIAYIEKIAVNWAQEEIFTVALAEKKLAEIQKRDGVWQRLCSDFGIQNTRPTAKQSEHLSVWVSELSFSYDIIHAAFEECINRTGKIQLSYINKILHNWHEKGVKALADTKGDAGKRSQPKGVSYDLDGFEQSLLKTPVYKKKKGDN